MNEAPPASSTAEAPDAPVSPEAGAAPFDLARTPISSFTELVAARGACFARRERLEALRRQVEALGTSGEEGRRRGIGLWMLGRYDEAARALSAHSEDDVAAFTRATALATLGHQAEAAQIFERLSGAYPDAARPRAGMLEARLEGALASGQPAPAAAALRAALAEGPASFAGSAEAAYLRGRAAELEQDAEAALDEYARTIGVDPTHRAALTRGAALAERCGLDYRALEWYEMLLALPPIEKSVLLNLGVLYEDLGRDADAAACYDTVVRSHPRDLRARLYMADAQAGMDMFYDEELERKEDRLNQILATPISDFELSVRARNCLNKMNIVTLGDLVRQTEQELLAYKNFGETSLNEIKEILASKNLRLGMAHHEAVASIEAAARPRATGENAEVLNRSVSDLDLSIRARRTVENLGCLTIGDIVQHSEAELLSMPNFGTTSIQELKRKLADLGLSLASKPS